MKRRVPPTHVLVVELPLDLDGDAGRDYSALQEALRMVLPVSRLAVDGVLCDDPVVTLRKALEDGPGALVGADAGTAQHNTTNPEGQPRGET